ncbi:unnamed protein product [Effrenium voratum]|nr:unnamed protein product [Effrenium voratum]CAJ1434628.1 unnamed protein product [Effrenium voratum]
MENCVDSDWRSRCTRAASLTFGDVVQVMLYQTLGVGGYVDLKETYSDAHETQHDWVFLAAAYLGRFAWGFWAVMTLLLAQNRGGATALNITGVQAATGLPIGRVEGLPVDSGK